MSYTIVIPFIVCTFVHRVERNPLYIGYEVQ
jgi:hypothetical protein